MKTLRFRIVQLLSAIILVAGVAVLAERNSRGQSPQAKREAQTQSPKESQTQSPQESQAAKTETLVKPTVLATDRPVTANASAAMFPEAAAQNTLLHTDLIWTFGKK